MSFARKHGGLLVILIAFLALGSLYLEVTPLLETPDEPSHFSVTKYIADEARLPPERPAPPDAGPVPVILPGPPVYYAPPLYYVLGALLVADLNTDGFAQAVIPNPNWARDWAPTPGRTPENKHIYVHTAEQRPPYAGWAAAMMRMRVFSLLLGATAVVGTYALARTLWSQPAGPNGRSSHHGWVCAATALVAFNPSFLFLTIGVTNDALLIALSAWTFVLMARLVSRTASNSWRTVALLGVLMGLAALTKQSTLAFLPVAALAVVWGARAGSQSRRVALSRLFLGAVLLAAVGGWWYLNNGVNYSDPLGFKPHQPPTGDWRPPLSFLARQLEEALRGYWGAFGWGLILVEPVVYGVFAFFVLAGLLGLLLTFLSGTRKWRSSTESRVIAVLAFGLLLNVIGLILWLWRTSAPYGRLLFPTLGPLAVLLVVGWQRWLGRKYSQPFAWAVTLALGLYAFIVPWRYLKPVYASPVVSLKAAEEATPLDVRFNDIIDLRGYRMTPDSVRPGDSVQLTLYWQASEALGEDLTIFVQLGPQDPERRVASADDFLGTSRYPTGVWQVGEVIQQVHQLRVPQDAPGPLLYWFAVGLYTESGGDRWPVNADGAPVPARAIRLGPLRVLSHDIQQPRQRVDYRFGSAIRLAGYDVDLIASPMSGESQVESVTVTLHWQAIAALETDLVVFVHLLDQDGHLVTQHDGAPRQGGYPTWAWQERDQVPDTHVLALPQNLPPGTYTVQVGLYQRDDGNRIPVFDNADERLPDDVVGLTGIRLPRGTEQSGD